MSTNLTFGIDELRGLPDARILCHNRLHLQNQTPALLAGIRDNAVPIGAQVTWFSDEGVQTRNRDPHGNRITYIPAYTLARQLAATPYLSAWDSAVAQFIHMLPPETRVVLWWH